MTHNGQAAFDGTLIEPQGVNAGDAIDALTTRTPRKAPTDEDPPPAPTPYELSRSRPQEMVGLPEQIPGYPGQQRSVETS
jgi:hypothetical protein